MNLLPTPTALLPPSRTPPAPASRTFPAHPEQVAQARRYLTALMADSPALPDSAVCVSELATNSISHSRSARKGGSFTVTVNRTAAGWRIEVRDAGGPWQPDQDRDDIGHRGLVIVAALAARWGIESRPRAGRTVWFEINDPPGATP